MAIFIVLVVLYLLTTLINKFVYPKIYEKTSKNPFTILHKVLCIVMGVFMFLLIPIDGEVSEFFGLAIAVEIISIALFVVLNLKYKEPKMIAIVTAIHAVYGFAFSARFLVWILSFALNMGGLVLGQDWKFGSSVTLFGGVKERQPETIKGSNIIEEINENAQKDRDAWNAAQEAEKERANEAAEAYAQHLGFNSAADAENMGIKTGKRD